YYEFEEAKKWNLAGWARPLVDITSFANSEVVEYQMKEVFDAVDVANQYLRINPELTIDVAHAIDDVSQENRHALRELGLLVSEQMDAQLDQLVELLVAE
ncbi:MAG: patatin, partial [Verrucomicrobia bacterium]|nr:patatin [Cytophagales bacterium]